MDSMDTLTEGTPWSYQLILWTFLDGQSIYGLEGTLWSYQPTLCTSLDDRSIHGFHGYFDRGYPLVLPTNTSYILGWSDYPLIPWILLAETTPWSNTLHILALHVCHYFFASLESTVKSTAALDMSGPWYTAQNTILVPGTQHGLQYWSLVHNTQ